MTSRVLLFMSRLLPPRGTSVVGMPARVFVVCRVFGCPVTIRQTACSVPQGPLPSAFACCYRSSTVGRGPADLYGRSSARGAAGFGRTLVSR